MFSARAAASAAAVMATRQNATLHLVRQGPLAVVGMAVPAMRMHLKHEKHVDNEFALPSVTSGNTGACFNLITSGMPPRRHRHFDVGVPTDKFAKYDAGYTDKISGKATAYMVIGTSAAMGLTLAKNVVAGALSTWNASADVLALASIEINIENIPEGKSMIFKWRGKPIFLRHRTADEIAQAKSVNVAELRDPEEDAARVKDEKYLVLVGVCTHLGCVPVGDAGDYGGWFCPCHGSHYDTSGRIRKGPAPLNLEIPPYKFIDNGTKVLVG